MHARTRAQLSDIQTTDDASIFYGIRDLFKAYAELKPKHEQTVPGVVTKPELDIVGAVGLKLPRDGGAIVQAVVEPSGNVPGAAQPVTYGIQLVGANAGNTGLLAAAAETLR